MARIIEPAHWVHVERRVRLFEYREDRNCGFQFDVVDGDGKPVFPCEAAERNFRYCIGHPGEYEDMGIVTQEEVHWQDARAVCECGKEIFLGDTYIGAGQCGNCGRWHNMYGQELLPPENWDVP